MEEESPDKFMGIEGHDSGFIVSLPIPVCNGCSKGIFMNML